MTRYLVSLLEHDVLGDESAVVLQPSGSQHDNNSHGTPAVASP
jgi:hypothetical protein